MQPADRSRLLSSAKLFSSARLFPFGRSFPLPRRLSLPRIPEPILTAGRTLRVLSATKTWLAVEFCLLFIGMPLLFASGALTFSPYPVILTALAMAMTVLLLDKSFPRRRFYRMCGNGLAWRRIVHLFGILALLLTAAVALAEEHILWQCIRERPLTWLAVVSTYPLFSVYPQEVLFRGFLFHRYKPLFGSTRALIHASALVFGLAHLIYGSLLAVVLAALGGWLFAATYARTRSLLLASIEHALYGCYLFTVGLGYHFFYGLESAV